MPVVKLLGDCSVGFQTVRHFFFAQADPYSNFDDEPMAFGAMFGQDMDRIIHELISFGYVSHNEGDKSGMTVSDMFSGTENLPSWIELADVTFLDESMPPIQAWKMKKSNVYSLLDFEANLATPTKEYECDWPSYIGKIN